jgi:hypothetical protein
MTDTRTARKARMTAAAAGRTEPAAAPPGRTAVRARPVRITTDLTPELHREVTRWTAAAADDLDVARLPVSDVVRAMIRFVLDDTTAGGAVIRALRDDRG